MRVHGTRRCWLQGAGQPYISFLWHKWWCFSASRALLEVTGVPQEGTAPGSCQALQGAAAAAVFPFTSSRIPDLLLRQDELQREQKRNIFSQQGGKEKDEECGTKQGRKSDGEKEKLAAGKAKSKY